MKAINFQQSIHECCVAFKSIVIIVATIDLTITVLYKPLNVSITICTNENAKYINAGGHNLNIFLLTLQTVLLI